MGKMEEDAREYDRKIREGTKKYDEEVGKWWRIDNAEQAEDEPDEDDED